MKSRLEREERSFFDKPEDMNHRLATQLVNASMSYARLILRRYGQIGPFGFGIDREGQVARETLSIPRLPHHPERLWKLLGDHMRERVRRGAIQGFAMAANFALDQPSAEGYADAVILSIELESGFALDVTIPYKIYGGQLHNLLPRRIAIGQLQSEETRPTIFSAAGPRKLS